MNLPLQPELIIEMVSDTHFRLKSQNNAILIDITKQVHTNPIKLGPEHTPMTINRGLWAVYPSNNANNNNAFETLEEAIQFSFRLVV